MEIERKFLVKKLPNLSGISPIRYERYFLPSSPGSEKRIQKKDDSYELEELTETSNLSRTTSKRQIDVEEFEQLKKDSSESLMRDGYLISNDPHISIKIYHGRFEGLVRAEVEFENQEEAKAFRPLKWFGEEITDSPLGRDSRLLKLSKEEFQKLIHPTSEFKA